MEQNIIEIIKKHISKSEEKLEAAKDLLEHGHIDDAISRAYYSVFHAASAVLLSKGITVNTHEALKTLFGMYFIQTGEIEKKYAQFIRNLKDDRENGDYDLYTVFEQGDAEEAITEAEEFLDRMKRYLREKYSIEL